MSKYLDKAKELRNDPVMHYNCAQAVVLAFSEDLGIDEETLMKLTANFGGGMKAGSVCGAVTSGAMVLGLYGMDNPGILNGFYREIKESHGGLINCADLLKRNAEMGGMKKPHCDAMICQSIGLIEEILKEQRLLKEE
jgi:C_GCAxxG_C_C family probable redox protein